MNQFSVRVVDDPPRLALLAGGALGHSGSAEVVPHGSSFPARSEATLQRLDFEAHCDVELAFALPPGDEPLAVTILADATEGTVAVPVEGFIVHRDGGGEATVEPASPRGQPQPEFPGTAHNGTRVGPWFWFETRTQDGDYAQAWGHAADSVHVRAGLPSPAADRQRTMRLVPLSAGIEPLPGGGWVRQADGEPVGFEVRVPANGTWRLGIEADWPGEPPTPAGQACWTLTSAAGDRLELHWRKTSGRCA